MDLIMPIMDGVEATRQIMRECPCAVLVTTATVQGNANMVFQALGQGALDAVNTPVLGLSGDLSGAEPLVKKLRQVAILGGIRSISPREAVSTPASPSTTKRLPPLLAIGASTGGPQALRTVFQKLPRPLPFPIVVVQHLATDYVPGLAKWLTDETQLCVELVERGDAPKSGCVQIACTEDHLILDGTGRLRYVREPVNNVYRPSVDAFFGSLRSAPIAPGVAVLLTGMGRDGAAGMKALRDAGWDTIAQDEASSVVWGMPGAASKIGAAARVLPIDAIGVAATRKLMKTNHQGVRHD
jgi:two-component system response regulator WspF